MSEEVARKLYRGWLIAVDKDVNENGKTSFSVSLARVGIGDRLRDDDLEWVEGLITHPSAQGALTGGRAEVDAILGEN